MTRLCPPSYFWKDVEPDAAMPPVQLWMNFGGWTQKALGAPLPNWSPIRSNVSVYNTMGQRVRTRGRVRSPTLIPQYPKAHTGTFTLTGVTRDSAGSALGSCVVKVFGTKDDLLKATTTSDGSGNYSVTLADNQPVYVVSYKTGSPDVSGTTLNTLVGV